MRQGTIIRCMLLPMPVMQDDDEEPSEHPLAGKDPFKPTPPEV